jgi:hypothetical protein
MAKRICALPECERPHYGKGYCRLHWRRLVEHGSATWEPPRQAEICIVDRCERPAWARDLCSTHYQAARKRMTSRKTHPSCHIEGCDAPRQAKDLCDRHYRRLRLYGDPLGVKQAEPKTVKSSVACKICDCTGEAQKRGWCGRHYLRWYKHGDPEWQRPTNAACIVDGCAQAPRSRYASMCDTHYCRFRRNGTLEVGQCISCQEPLPTGSMTTRKYCPSCYLDRRRRLGRDYENRRRALAGHEGAERIDSLEIYERDGWRCGLCKRKVSPGHIWPHPKSPSLDHIVPLIKGGPHVRTNVQLAHLGCNASKRDRGGGEQLLLIG